MAADSVKDGRARYIVHAQDARRLADFVHEIRARDDVELVDLIGPADAPHIAVLHMPRATARELQERFRTTHQIFIEPDQPLSPLCGGVAGPL
ncbi:MAG TPA: hypothetical protein VM406_05310 [Noviherbaspirillum sp.]|nr:hypothetical protein [Noviherbaspirillum sp.]